MDMHKAFHGGKSFEAIGEDFRNLELAGAVINADVLDAWFDPSPRVVEKVLRFLPFLARTSPPIYAAGLVFAIARSRGTAEDCILTGGGSSDLIFTCFPHLFSGIHNAMILDPMYGEYRHVLRELLEVDAICFDLHKEEDFRIDTDRLLAQALTKRPEVVVIVNPNSPTGQHWAHSEIIRFLDRIPECMMVVIDETYIEYAGSGQSVEREACKRPNLIVLKSMSKVYALSGMRVGYLVAHPSTIRVLAKWLPPWAVGLPAQVAAVEALSDDAYYASRYQETHLLREELVCCLRQHSQIRVYPSMTNLVLIETQSSAQEVVERMRESNVFIRNCDSMSRRFADRFLRIAVKRAPENSRIVAALSQAVSTPPVIRF